ncbi:MAG: hypothetical protein GF308_07770 [Candidatus Heimdallarchaeota archaeon]|nr:hypothetical protein [Candidatus Heimdallarchaeota archaeon]
MIFHALTIPTGIIATIAIFYKNVKNIPNILIGLVIFFGAVIGSSLELVIQLIYSTSPSLALLFAKISHFAFIIIITPFLVFHILYQKTKHESLSNWFYIIPVLPTLFLTVWLFAFPETLTLVEQPYGIVISLTDPYRIVAAIVLLVVLIIFILEFSYMAYEVKEFPLLTRLMGVFIFGFTLGVGGKIFSVFFFPLIFEGLPEPSALFVFFGTIIITVALSITISPSTTVIWHGCPKLYIDKSGQAYCMNAGINGVPREIQLFDIGNMIEKVQIDLSHLKTDKNYCSNLIFAKDDGIVRCVATHQPIEVLGEGVTKEEMKFTREMLTSLETEFCADCLHKVIVYLRKHEELTENELKDSLSGCTAEDFFGIK